MFRRNSRFKSNDGFFDDAPLFFKLWFAFVALVTVGLVALMVAGVIEIVSLLSDPQAIGTYFGEVTKGFNGAPER